MEYLASCHTGTTLEEPQEGQTIHFEAPQDWEFAVYTFAPDHFFPGDKSPDGVILVRRPLQPASIVCFVELKTSPSSAASRHAREQLEQGMAHFAPWKRCACGRRREQGKWIPDGLCSHGDAHHTRWGGQGHNSDRLTVSPEASHEVWGLRIVWRQGHRSPHFNPGKPLEICGKRLRFATVSLSLTRPGRQNVNLRLLFQKAGLGG